MFIISDDTLSQLFSNLIGIGVLRFSSGTPIVSGAAPVYQILALYSGDYRQLGVLRFSSGTPF